MSKAKWPIADAVKASRAWSKAADKADAAERAGKEPDEDELKQTWVARKEAIREVWR